MEVSKCKLSVIVITLNEERNIAECLQSVQWADEIILVDSESSDNTVEIAKNYTSKIFIRKWDGYSSTKNFALQQCKNDWILWLDADERVTPELKQSIQQVVNEDGKNFDGYEVSRRAYFLKKWIRHCGWYPGYVVRFFRKNKAKFIAVRVHESIEIEGKIGKLKGNLIHYTDENIKQYFEKFNMYTSLASVDLYENGKRFSIIDLTIRPLFMFFKMFFLRLGFLDGIHGFILSVLSSAYVFVKYAKLWEIQSRDSK